MILSLLRHSWPGMEAHDFTPPPLPLPPLLSSLPSLLARDTSGDLWSNDSDVNIAPVDSSTEGLMWVTVVDTVLLACTIIGTLIILITMLVLEVRGRPSTTRMRIVQALILSDLMLGIVGLVSSAVELSPQKLQFGTTTCSGLGFMLVVVLWSEHLWTLILAIVTYLILIHPLAKMTILLERRWFYLWGLVWVFSFTIAIVGYEIYGYYPAGGICYYGQNAGLYGELIQFIPRAIVFLVITGLYARLYVFLRRPDKIRGTYSNSGSRSHRKISEALHFSHRSSGPMGTGDGEKQNHTHFMSFIAPRKISDFLRGRASFSSKDNSPEIIAVAVERRPSARPVTAEDDQQVAVHDYANGPNRRSSAPEVLEHAISPTRRGTVVGALSPLAEEHSHGGGGNPTDSPKCITPAPTPVTEIPPWERMELPAFEIDGQRYGGSAANVHREHSLWGGWKGLGGRSNRHRPTSGGGSSTGGRLRTGDSDALRSSMGSVNLTPAVSPGTHTAKMPNPLDAFTNKGPSPPRSRSATRRASFNPNHEIIESDRVRKASGISSPLSEGHTAHSDAGDSDSEASPGETAADDEQDSPKAKDFDPEYRRPSSTFAALEPPPSEGSRRSSASGGSKAAAQSRKSSHTSDLLLPAPRPLSPRQTDITAVPGSGDPEKGGAGEEGEEDGEDDMWDLSRMLAADGGTRRSTNGANGEGGSPRGEEETYEFVQESMASYLNRKTALLMLWFPLGYVLLFSVSLIRVIYDLAGNPPPALRAISRWFIFAQGILDALIYGLVEWHTKRVVRKRVRKGTFSPSGSGSGSALHHAFRNWSKGHRPPNNTGVQTAGVSGTGTNPRLFGSISSVGVGSRFGDTRNILQELGLGDSSYRRGSGPSQPNTPALATETEKVAAVGIPHTMSAPS